MRNEGRGERSPATKRGARELTSTGVALSIGFHRKTDERRFSYSSPIDVITCQVGRLRLARPIRTATVHQVKRLIAFLATGTRIVQQAKGMQARSISMRHIEEERRADATGTFWPDGKRLTRILRHGFGWRVGKLKLVIDRSANAL
jgi:hypothetical protein